MNNKTAPSLVEQLKQIPDPRVKRTQRHELMDILVIALCATICGADNWVSVVQFGKSKIDWLLTFLKLPNGIASHDTFGRIFQILDSAVLERVCIEWLQGIAGKVEGVVSIDGKTLCGSRDGDRSPLHLVSACPMPCFPNHGMVLLCSTGNGFITTYSSRTAVFVDGDKARCSSSVLLGARNVELGEVPPYRSSFVPTAKVV